MRTEKEILKKIGQLRRAHLKQRYNGCAEKFQQVKALLWVLGEVEDL
jgi:hypothetical protein